MRPTGLTVDLLYERAAAENPPTVRPPAGPAVGIDLGVNHRLTLSDGTIVQPREIDRTREENLRRRISTARKGSNRRHKRVKGLAKECRRNQVRNRNQCHRITSKLVREYSLIAIENLKLRNLTASANGTVEEPGSNVKQKAGLNRSILEQSLGLITQQLRYKAEWAGVQLIAVNPANTSRTCSTCGAINGEKLAEYRVFRCPGCGLETDRDLNAAINILNKGLKAQQGGNPPAAPPGAMTTGGLVPQGSSCM